MYLDHETATDAELISYCSSSNPDRHIVSQVYGGVSVVRISEKAVVKVKYHLSQDEFNNQKRAYELVDPKVIRIPRVYRYFSHDELGYIVMEYIDGEVLDPQADAHCVDAITRALSHFAQIRGEKPGPLSRGVSKGLLWSMYHVVTIKSVRDIEEYYKPRLKPQGLDLQAYPLVLCHLDIAPRNILRLKDGSLCLLDWASAGFYPRLFETCTLRLNARKKDDFNHRLLASVERLSDSEETQAQLLERAYYLGVKYIYWPEPLRLVLPPELEHLRKKKKKTTKNQDKTLEQSTIVNE